jgi:hypothetical protein
MAEEQLTCPNCEQENQSKAIYCRNCGYNLRDYLHSSDQTLFVGQAARSESMSIHERRAYFSRDAHLALLVVGTETILPCDLSQNSITMGRKSENEALPHVNLTSYGAAELGVSRVHARLTRMNAILMLEDMGATNGTFVNGERISPIKPCVICHDDEIRLGNLKLQVIFQTT